MNRRELLKNLAVGLAAAPLARFAQAESAQPSRPVFVPAPPAPANDEHGLQVWIDGEQMPDLISVIVEHRSAEIDVTSRGDSQKMFEPTFNEAGVEMEFYGGLPASLHGKWLTKQECRIAIKDGRDQFYEISGRGYIQDMRLDCDPRDLVRSFVTFRAIGQFTLLA